MRKIFVSLWILSSLLSVFFLGKVGFELERYFSLQAKAPAKGVFLEVVEKDASSFVVEVTYRFSSKGKEFDGKTELMKPYFLNRASAERAVLSLSAEPWEVFYNSSHPDKNSLQKRFPFLTCIHALLILGILVYFILLEMSLRRRFV